MDLKVKIETRGLDAIEQRLADADAIVRKTAFDALAKAQTAIQTGAKTGRIYSKKRATGKGANHQASAPGQAPASDTGFLVNSGFARRTGKTSYEVGFSAEYAEILEERRDRPFLGPALRAVSAGFRAAIEAIFKGKTD